MLSFNVLLTGFVSEQLHSVKCSRSDQKELPQLKSCLLNNEMPQQPFSTVLQLENETTKIAQHRLR
jgi:hypothetical protein